VAVPEIELVCVNERLGVKLPLCDVDIEKVALEVIDGEIVSTLVIDGDGEY